MNLKFIYRFLFLVAVAVPAMSQDELPTPEAFANECKADMLLYLQQMNGIIKRFEADLGPDPHLAEEMDLAYARLDSKVKFCEMTSKFLGPEYKSRWDQMINDSELKLAMYKLMKAMEKIKIESQLRKNMDSSKRLDSLREAYILAIRQKIERNWLKPAGSEQMPDCEVNVQQGPGGIILGVSFGECGGNAIYRESIENAVRRADPLPTPTDPTLFQREVTLIFKPD